MGGADDTSPSIDVVTVAELSRPLSGAIGEGLDSLFAMPELFWASCVAVRLLLPYSAISSFLPNEALWIGSRWPVGQREEEQDDSPVPTGAQELPQGG